jgi:hypothetical protein
MFPTIFSLGLKTWAATPSTRRHLYQWGGRRGVFPFDQGANCKPITKYACMVAYLCSKSF